MLSLNSNGQIHVWISCAAMLMFLFFHTFSWYWGVINHCLNLIFHHLVDQLSLSRPVETYFICKSLPLQLVNWISLNWSTDFFFNQMAVSSLKSAEGKPLLWANQYQLCVHKWQIIYYFCLLTVLHHIPHIWTSTIYPAIMRFSFEHLTWDMMSSLVECWGGIPACKT